MGATMPAAVVMATVAEPVATRISTAGRGEHQPIADNTPAEGRAKNRRVEIFLREPAKTGG